MRYIVNPVLSTLSRRSLYQFPPGCTLHHFIISLLLARIAHLFLLSYSSPLLPTPPLLSSSFSLARSRFHLFPSYVLIYTARYNPGTLANNRPFSIPDPHYTIDLYRNAILIRYTRILFILGNCISVPYQFCIVTLPR